MYVNNSNIIHRKTIITDKSHRNIIILIISFYIFRFSLSFGSEISCARRILNSIFRDYHIFKSQIISYYFRQSWWFLKNSPDEYYHEFSYARLHPPSLSHSLGVFSFPTR